MAKSGSIRSDELACRTATNERSVREWLHAQVVGGYALFDSLNNHSNPCGERNSNCWSIPVANSPHRLQRVPVCAQLLPHRAHHRLYHVAGRRFLAVSPDRLDQFVARNGLVRPGQKICKDPELKRRETKPASV